MPSLTKGMVTLFRETFVGRSDDYSVQRSDGSYARAGKQLTDQTIADHLTGKISIATYCIDECGLCKYAVIDGDQQGDLERLLTLQHSINVYSHLEQSRRGGHLWIFTQPCKPSDLRLWIRALAPRGMELYPKQDECNGGVGSAIRLPFGIHRKSGKRYPFVDSILRPISSSMLTQIELISRSQKNIVPLLTDVHHTEDKEKSSSLLVTRDEILTIREWNSKQNARSIIARYVDLSLSGLGKCPFVAHHAHGDQKPSFQFFEPRTPGGLCWRCYSSELCGSLFDFLKMYHSLSTIELISRIRGGATW